jgi:tRNA modification GTPase
MSDAGRSATPDTIAAISTAPGRGAVGIVRLSGSDLRRHIDGIIGRDLTPRLAARAAFRDASADPIDEGVAIYFAAPHSYTGEHVLELQGHGGPIVMNLLLQRCMELGARIAEPGEFTRRAYLNNRLDLAQAEAVIDVIDANTERAARSAMRSLRGEFSTRIAEVSTALINARMHIEATLDFPEEELGIDEISIGGERLQAVASALSEVLGAARHGSVLREGIRVVLVGQPNVGKSSLLNRLAGEELAIVTDVPGTTRDAVRQLISIEGIPIHIIDTAGLRSTMDVVEQIGISRAWDAASAADVVIVLMEARYGRTDADNAILERLPAAIPRLHVLNKADLVPPGGHMGDSDEALWISAKTGAGIEALKQALVKLAGGGNAAEGVFMARARHVAALEEAQRRVLAAAEARQQPELVAEELRRAQLALGAITGEFTADELLGEIFSRFCIGK